ncbi:MAG: magnesium transporter [Armatimonadota bacterium]|nr:magnesium transporter [Armatimonadota bacterium]MDR7438643.1 magnesium transporter [Armatimonadota bacterium]MDR7562636.1 magnesium transporter [Armatimonadota bacterium]MDR7567210.1 magnesium transporter [Armatimonadota bacterium]MDR7602779.1 magnesium transporter [Armatimonadota bacterium]
MSSLLDRAREYLAARQPEALRALAAELHPADLADLFLQLEFPERLTLLLLLDMDRAAQVLEELPDEVRLQLVEHLGDEEAGRLILQMGTDEAADVLGELSRDRLRRLLEHMGREAEAVEELLRYPEDTAGGLMTTEYVAVLDHLRVQDAVEELRRVGQEVELPYYVYVVDPEGQLRGVVSLRDLVVAPPDAPVREVMRTDLVTVRPEADREEAARLLEKYDLLALPVCDAQGRLLGIITADDLLRVTTEEGTEDVLRLAGAPAPLVGLAGGLPWRWVARRAGFLAFNLILDVVAAVLISRFQSTLERTVALAFFFPMIAATAGNVGTQSLAVAVRGMATGFLAENQWEAAAREVRTGAVVGGVCGLLAFLFAALWQGNLALGLVVGSAMSLSLTLAAALGMLVPFGFVALRVDPAVASGPFLTTLTDNLSLGLYLLLATLVLGGMP